MKSVETLAQKINKFETSLGINSDITFSDGDIEQYANEKQSYVFGLAIARLNMLFSKAIKKDDLRTALSIQIEIAELYGLHHQKQNDNEIVTVYLDKSMDEVL